jgi:broad-specificity NMP kinase
VGSPGVGKTSCDSLEGVEVIINLVVILFVNEKRFIKRYLDEQPSNSLRGSRSIKP